MTVVQARPAPSTSPPHLLVWTMLLVPAAGTAAALALAFANGGVLAATPWLFSVFYFASSCGIEVGYHRYYTHRAFKARPSVRLALGFLGSMAGQGPVLFWTVVHRAHHRHADTAADPHTPHPASWRGFWRAHVGWLFTEMPTDIGKIAPDLIRDPTTLRVQRLYLPAFVAGLLAPALLGAAFNGGRGALEGLLWGGFARVFVNHQVTWSINSICHLFGSRPNATSDHSRNVWFLALPTLGQAWHNNHHACPAAATLDFRWWQVDPGAWIIRTAAAVGLVSDVKEHAMLRGSKEAAA